MKFMNWRNHSGQNFETDHNKGMTVQYNILNLPKEVKIKNPVVYDGRIKYEYSADGLKRRVIHEWYEPGVIKPVIIKNDPEAPNNDEKPGLLLIDTKTTDYAGNKIYKNGNLDMILLGNGYIKDNVYYFFISDHLGSNRVVMKESNNSVVQRRDYYPSGTIFADYANQEVQPYGFTGHEFDSMHGINLSDHYARFLDHTIGPRWLAPDPKAEKYYPISPYVYCLNNPLKYIDPDGREVTNSIYVINNPNMIEALATLNYLIMQETGLANNEFTIKITGGDRYRGEDGKPYSLSESWQCGAENSPHLIENGARGVDLKIEKSGGGLVDYDLIIQLHQAAGFNYWNDKYDTGHLHLTLKESLGVSGLTKDDKYIPTKMELSSTPRQKWRDRYFDWKSQWLYNQWLSGEISGQQFYDEINILFDWYNN